MSIFFNESNQTFYLESKDVTYAFRIHPCGILQHLYFGKKVARDDLAHTVHYTIRGHATNNPLLNRSESLDNLPLEAPYYGRSDFREPLFAFDVNGVRVGDFLYADHEILSEKPKINGMPSLRGGETLVVKLKDSFHEIAVYLYYTVYEELSAITRRVIIANEGENKVRIDRAYSFSLDLPDNKYQAITLPGAHLRERNISRNDLVSGIFSAESKFGVSSGQMNPFMAIVRKNTDEFSGEAYGFNLIYSGNFALKAEISQCGSTRVLGGINDYDFSWSLGSGEIFSTPEAVMVYSANGLGEMSRTFHDLYREYLLSPKFAKVPHPVILNNWEGTYFDFNEEKLCALIESASGTGIDMFVLDDGWFGARNGESAGLGDWVINYNKLPGGFDRIIECAHKHSMKFGLWFEPEMVNIDSDLYRAHPDWAIHADGISPCTGRLQLVLDLSRKEVCDYIVESMSKVLEANDIEYVKWDMNRSITENYSEKLGENGKEFAHRYVLGLYNILERLTTRFPYLFIEGCASGGCRYDAAMLYYCPQIWTSDDSDAYARTAIQYGTSLCYPLSSMSCHVSVCPNHQTGRNTPFSARTAIAHLGATGYELDPTKLSEKEHAQIKGDIDAYRAMQDLVLEGDLYRLNDPLKENLFAEMLVSKDQSRALITVMKPINIANDFPTRIYPRGLDENATYTVKELNLTLKGSTIMNAGLILYLPWGDFQTGVYNIVRV